MLRRKNEKTQLREKNDELVVDVMRLNCELEEYKKEYKSWNKNETEKLALMESNAIIQSKLSQVNTEVTRKQTEVIPRLASFESIRESMFPSFVCSPFVRFFTLKQLKTFGSEALNFFPDHSSERRNRQAESYETSGADVRNFAYPVLLQNKYDRDIVELGQQIKKLQKENLSLKHLLNDQAKQQPRKALANSKKEDAHLLATIRGLQTELNSREKDIARLNKELLDARKTNRRLQQERERVLTTSTSKMRGLCYVIY
ncbi:unnamed protein product [Nesidiocoris tenuis]|uniref:Uncharacterized protein n=1 Tax=Nesidiocoris tenuis TaxID=355587 RepID=A0A6H5HA24_9HEMI|nr:unnamed protein product [Nesidiocoris tenuis]